MKDYLLFGFLTLFPIVATIWLNIVKESWLVEEIIAFYVCAGLLFLGGLLALIMKIRGE